MRLHRLGSRLHRLGSRLHHTRAMRFLRVFIAEADDDRVLGLGAETAFFAVLSIFPGLLIAVSLLGLADVVVGGDLAQRAQDRVVEALQLVLTDEASGAIASVRALFEQPHGGVLTLASVGALITLSGAFAVVINALNLAYDIDERRSWLRRRVLGLLLALGTLALMVVSLVVVVLGPLLGRGGSLADQVGLGHGYVVAWNLLRLPVLGAVLVLWLAALFHLAPNRRTTWRSAVPGAVFTGALWLVATAGFRLYLAVVAQRNPILGAFGGGLIVMTWVYLLSIALLLGGELNAILIDRRAVDDACRGDRAAEQLALFPR